MGTMAHAAAMDEPGAPRDPGAMIGQAARMLAEIEAGKGPLMARAAGGDGNARALLSAMPVLRGFVNTVTPAWFAACAAAERELRALAEENARLRGQLEAARPRARRAIVTRDRPILNVVS